MAAWPLELSLPLFEALAESCPVATPRRARSPLSRAKSHGKHLWTGQLCALGERRPDAHNRRAQGGPPPPKTNHRIADPTMMRRVSCRFFSRFP